MSHSNDSLLLSLPIELIYRILDRLEPFDILISVRDVCTRLDAITDTYGRYLVGSIFTLSVKSSSCSKDDQ